MTYDTLQVELQKNQGLTPDGHWVLSETHLRTTEMAGSPFWKIVSTTDCTLRAVAIPTLEYTGIHTRPNDLLY
jgi:hypothetical protein